MLPHEIQIASAGIDVLPALAITLVYGTLLGYVLFLVVYRPLLRAAPLTKVCASVGVMLGLEAIAVLNFGTTSLATGPVLPSTPIRIAGVAFPSDRLVLLGIVVVAAVGLLALYRFTRFGGKHVMMRKFETTEVFRLIEREGAQSLSVVPAMATALVNCPERPKFNLKSLERIKLGGAASSPTLVREVEEKLGWRCLLRLWPYRKRPLC